MGTIAIVFLMGKLPATHIPEKMSFVGKLHLTLVAVCIEESVLAGVRHNREPYPRAHLIDRLISFTHLATDTIGSLCLVEKHLRITDFHPRLCTLVILDIGDGLVHKFPEEVTGCGHTIDSGLLAVRDEDTVRAICRAIHHLALPCTSLIYDGGVETRLKLSIRRCLSDRSVMPRSPVHLSSGLLLVALDHFLSRSSSSTCIPAVALRDIVRIEIMPWSVHSVIGKFEDRLLVSTCPCILII